MTLTCDNCGHLDVPRLRPCPHDPDCSLRICDRCFRSVQSNVARRQVDEARAAADNPDKGGAS